MKKVILFAIFCSGIYIANAQTDETKKDSVKYLKEVILEVPNPIKYKTESSQNVSKMPLDDIENPQVYNSIPSQLLKDQVVTTFNDALKNATGITRLWESTGRGTDGAEYFTIRGFSVQPTMLNGLPGINNGTIDPANIESVEVIKGPSGTLYGSSLISYGGLINIVTKKPKSEFGGEISYNAGSFGSDRITADINIPLDKQKNTLLRINTAYQKENSFQDAGFNKSFFIAPSLKHIVNDKLYFLINTEFTQREAANNPMIFLNRNSPLTFNSIDLFEQNYKNSFNSNDLTILNPTFTLQAQMMYQLSPSWTSQTVLSRGTSKTNGYYHYLYDMSDGNSFQRYIAKLNGETYNTDIQQNFIGDFNLGKMRNRVVVGLDYYKSNILNGGSGWVANGLVTLQDGQDTGDLTQAGIDDLLVGTFSGNSTAVNEVYSAYASNVLNILPQLSVMASLRIDQFKSSTSTSDDAFDQTAVSPKFGIVYQPILNKVSVFANYMNGFRNLAPNSVSDADGTNQRLLAFDPEQANQFEVGVKTNIFKDKLALTASYYNIIVSDRVIPDPNNPNSFIQGGESESKGIELSLVANPIEGLNIIAGYSNNDSEVTKDSPAGGYLGLRPESAGPETLINFWANYSIPKGSLKGFGIGFGGNYASEFQTLNRTGIGSFDLPSYTILNSALSYDHPKFNITLKLNNALNEKYYSGWSTVTPQRLRSLIAGLTYKF